MPSFYNYNPEKKDASFIDIYFIAGIVACAFVVFLVASGYGIKFLIAFVIKYYLWVFGVLALIAIARHYWMKGKRRAEACAYH